MKNVNNYILILLMNLFLYNPLFGKECSKDQVDRMKTLEIPPLVVFSKCNEFNNNNYENNNEKKIISPKISEKKINLKYPDIFGTKTLIAFNENSTFKLL